MPKLQKMKLDIFLTVILVLLISVGILFIFSASSIMALENFNDIYYFIKKHIINLALGITAAIIVAKIPYQTVRGLIVPINVVTIILLIMVLIPAFNVNVNGAGRWLNIAGFTFQPSEVAKITVIFTLAHMIDIRRSRGILNKKEGLIPIGLYIAFYVGLIFFEKHLSAVGIITIVSMIMLLIGGIKWRYFIGAAGLGLVFAVIGVIVEPFRMKRIFAFLNPEANPLGSGYHVIQSYYALGSGEWFGMGLGMSRQKYGWLPENHTDFILAIIGEEAGFFGVMFVIVLFILFMFRTLMIANNAPDGFGTMIVAGVVALVLFQAMFNMMVVGGLAPVTGIPLPFISYGGTSTIILFIAIGLILNVGNQVDLKELEQK